MPTNAPAAMPQTAKARRACFPRSAARRSVQQSDPTTLLHVVLRGALSVGTKQAPTAPAMPAFAWLLNDDQVAAVLTYIRNAWGNAAPAVERKRRRQSA